MKISIKKRVLTFILSVTIFTPMVASLPINVITAKTSSEFTNENLLKYPSFEEDIPLEKHNDDNKDNKVGNWFYFQDTVRKEQGNANTGNWSVSLENTNDALEQDIGDLQKGSAYKVSVWAKNTNPNETEAYLCLKNYGGEEKKVLINSKEYKKYEIEFIYTGDMFGKNTRVATWVKKGGNGKVYVDDWSFEISSDLKKLSIDNGYLELEYKDDYIGEINSSNFDISYISSLDPGVSNKLNITNEIVDGKTLIMNFEPFKEEAVEQNIKVTVIYKPNNQILVVDFNIGESGEEIVEAKIKDISSKNGEISIILDKTPTLNPIKEDFIVEYKIDDEFIPIEIEEMFYDKLNKKVEIKFSKISSLSEGEKVIVKVKYKGNESFTDFIVDPIKGVNYYVDYSLGNDLNDGMSEDNAWKTIDKVNSIIFNPGDKILFKSGEEWTGALKPQGSGIEGAPIIISSYGEGKKPLLKPGKDWTISHMNVANRVIKSPIVNNVITFNNQQYWEVSNLELWDPTYEQNSNTNVYRRGINVSAQDAGDLRHFKFDNLTIHGFRGPISNDGKSSGGIIMTVTTDLYDKSKRVPTSINDISITNCEMYNLGRSGVNFVSPWTTREGEKWNKYKPFGYPGVGAWKPYENFRLSNNIIYNIDGDGAIIDNCKDAIINNNTVYRTVYNCWYGVGLFNWNSDNVIFEFNEVYEASPADSILGAGDGQGIEIDALNQNTIVQYNYLHNNAGGIFMWCSTEDLRSFDGIYRYNISQNDGAKHGIIDWRPGHEGSMAYNNTIYLDDSIERKWMNNGYTGGKSDAKFYNNIFINKGKMTISYFNEEEIDYESNIFYGFDKVPENDSTVIQDDPLLIAEGTGDKGIDSVKGYMLQKNSPAIDAGINIENNGGRDYFGNKLIDGKVDIGVAEYVEEDKPIEVDKSLLELVIEYAESKKLEGALDDVVPAVVKEFEVALEEAKIVLNDDKATETQVELASNRLINVIHMLEFKKGDKSELKKLVDLVNSLNSSEYTSSTWSNLESKIENAINVINNENAMDKEISEAYEALNDAFNNLELVANKSMLEELIKELERKDLSQYTLITVNALKLELDNARSVLDNSDANQSEVDEAYNRLIKSYLNLRLIPDKSKLEELINKVKNVDLSKYTNESVNGLKNNLEYAKNILNDDNVTQDEINEAEKKLEMALNNLELEKDENVNTLPKTGGESSKLVIVLAILLIGLGAIFTSKTKKLKYKN